MTEMHLFVYDAQQTRDAMVPGSDDLVLFCTCGLPQHNQHHLNGYEAVDALLAAKWKKHNEERQAILALEKLALKLYYAEHYPAAHYITYFVSRYNDASLHKLYDKDGWLVADDGEADEPGWLASIVHAEGGDELDEYATRDLATWTEVDEATYDSLKHIERPAGQ